MVGSLMRISVFFFSSRRRHTRFDCDWSSDVCSSDLLECAVGNSNRPGSKKKPPARTWTRCNTSRTTCVTSRRSEEHTSELQSQSNLVCRLLLEKKKKYNTTTHLSDIKT